MEDLQGRKRQRYVCLTPTYIAWFHDEAAAEVSEEGFMCGDADHKALSSLASHGASVQLSNLYECEVHPSEPQFSLVMREGLEDGTQAVVMHTANAEIAAGWAGAINAQKERYKSVRPPPRAPRPERADATPVALAALAAGEAAFAAAVNSDAARGLRAGFFGVFGLKSPDEPVKDDSEYDAKAPWAAKGVDLTAKEARSCLSDEHGHPATVLHGWLTKKNKSGVYAGSVEKERYFVLTPEALCFFPDARAADVRNGYMWGKAEGSKIGSGFLKAVGAALPLEAVCEVRLMSKDGKAATSTFTASPKALRGGGGGDDEDEDDEAAAARAAEEEDEDDEGGGGGGGKKKKAAAKKGGKKAPLRVPPPPRAPPGGLSNLIELDFGDFNLAVNAHNATCRGAWVKALRVWTGIRKRQRDEELFGGGGGGF